MGKEEGGELAVGRVVAPALDDRGGAGLLEEAAAARLKDWRRIATRYDR
jgi:hypothetical protein